MKSLLFWLLFLFVSTSATAHKIAVDILYQDGIAYVECWMGSDEAAANAPLEVRDSEGNLLHTGKLDEDGFYEYRPTKADLLTFSVNAGLGHKGEAELDLRGVELPSPDKPAFSDEPTMSSTPIPEPVESQKNVPKAVTNKDSRKPQIRSSEGGLTDGERIVLGVICLASLTAALLSYRNQQRIAAIEEKLRARDMDSR